MAKGDFITEEVKGIIVDVYLIHPDWIAKEVMNEVHRRLGKMKSKGYTWPGLISIRKKLAEIRKQPLHVDDQLWSISSIEKPQTIPPDTLPYVLQSWVYALEHLKTVLTIREAKWVARLSYVIKDIDSLISTALLCARRELIAEITGEQKDHIEDDLKLFFLMSGEEMTDSRKTQILNGPKYGSSREELETVLKLIKEAREEIQKRRSTHERSHT
ncbi:hypothetical protein ES703_104172 [subsurface metagenome]